MIWFIYAFTGAFFLLAYLTRVPASSADPTNEEDLNRPTVSQSLSIPVVFGTRGVSAPNVLDSGNLSTVEIKVKQKTLFGSKKVSTGAFKHFLDELHAIAWGPGTLKEIWSGDFLAWSGSVSTASTILISGAKLYGDGKTDGGIEGYVDILVGEDAQTPPVYIENRLGRLQPGMPGVAQAVFRGLENAASGLLGLVAGARGFYFGNTPTLKPIKYVWQFLPNPFSHGTNFDINGDANPVLCLYEMYINDQWGLNLNAPIDTTSFQAAAQTLFDEGLGYSRTWYKGEGKDVEDEILRHCNAVRYRHPTTGAITIKLIRDDYVVGNLETLDETNIIDYPKMRRNRLSTLATEIKVTYLDRAENDKKRSLTLPSLANRLQLGRRNAVMRDFYGASTADVCRKLSAREGRQVFYPLRATKLVSDRIAWDWTPGHVFKLSHSEMGLAVLVARVVKIQRGNLLDGKVALEVVEDVFSYGATVFDPPVSSGTTPLTSEPADVTSFYFMELPVFLISDEPVHQLALFAEQPSGDSTDFGVEYEINNGGFKSDGDGSFTTVYAIDAAATETDTTLVVVGDLELDSASAGEIATNGTNILIVTTAAGQEIIAVESAVYDSGTGKTTLSGVHRGLIDTHPKPIAAADKVWLYEPFIFSDAFNSGNSVDVKMLTRTGRGELDAGSATERNHVISQRVNKPLRPANVRLNSNYFPAAVVGPLTVSWADRDETATTSVLDWTDPTNQGPAGGTTYKVEFYNDDTSALLQSNTGIGGNSDSWTDPGQSYNIRVEVTAQNGGLDSEETFVFVTAFSEP